MASDPSSSKEPALGAVGGEAHSLILGARDGDPDRVDAWFRLEYPAVFRLCYGFLANRADAEDLSQDAMLHLLDHLGQWNPERPYGPWRDRVVANLCRDRRRRSAARERAHRDSVPDGEPSRAADPREDLERAELGDILSESLRRLTPREREVFVLRDLEQHSTEETASTLGIEPATVRSMLTLARRRLRNLLQQRFGGAIPGLPDLEEEGAHA